MKQTIFTLLLITSIGLISCRKTSSDPNITQYDQNQIQSYIQANGLTSMKRDTAGGDTSGIYYQIINQGSTSADNQLSYSDSISFVFTLKSFDGKYTSVDSLRANHYDSFLGHVSAAGLPRGLQQALYDVVKYHGTSARLLIPSRLAYGISGYGSGSSTNANTRIAGNQCLDYYVNVIKDQVAYDDYVIKNYMSVNSITGFTKITTGRGAGLYYKVHTVGTGTDVIGQYSAFTADYSAQYLDLVALDSGTAASFDNSSSTSAPVVGVQEGLKGQTVGSSITLLVPSRLAYGKGSSSVAADVCFRFDFTIDTVTNP
jgi:FKBP-type peptidyl-prolyl cis-trans isomerase